MKSSFRILSVFGISVELHATFILFALFLLPVLGFAGIFFFATVFSFVLLHELSHSLVAKTAGVPVDRIVLTFFGGIANVEVPEKPRLELLMASAGPMFNFLVVGLCFLLVQSLGLPSLGYSDVVSPEKFVFNITHILHTVLYINLLLGLFNVVPGFPMDGGRILRSLLALKMDYIKATQLSVSAGQQLIFPLLFVLGLMGRNIIMVVIAVVLFIASGSELKVVKLRRVFDGLTAGDVALKSVPKVEGSMFLRDFVTHMAGASATHYIVHGDGGRVLGVLDLEGLKTLNQIDFQKPVKGFITQEYVVLDASKKVSDSIKEVLSNDFVLVVSDKKVVGYITPQSITEAYYFWGLKKAVK